MYLFYIGGSSQSVCTTASGLQINRHKELYEPQCQEDAQLGDVF